MTNLTDKRILKTRTGIKNALMLLAIDTDTAEISVSALTKKARINRSTFYLHYSSITDVMNDIEKEIRDTISSCIENFDFKDVYKSTYTLFTNLTDTLNANTEVRNYILNSTASNHIVNRLKEILVENALPEILKQFPERDKNEIKYSVIFVASGILDTYTKWAHTKDGVSLEELIKTVSTLIQTTMA